MTSGVLTDIGFIPSDWKVKKLGDLDKDKNSVKTGPFGSLLHSYDYSDEGRPLLLVKNIDNGELASKEYPLVNEKKATELKQFWLEEGDIVYTRVGEVGRILYVTQDYVGWMFSGQTLRIRIKNKEINPLYVSYFLRSSLHKKIASMTALGSTRESINTSILKDSIIPVPPIIEQTFIANTLSYIDQKISLLRSQNETLEQIAQTLFKRWFLDFEFPNQNGKPYKSTGGKMVPSELGEIPEGWRVGKLGELVEIGSSKRIFAREYQTGGIPFYRGKEVTQLSEGNQISTELFISNERYDELKQSSGVPKKGDILLTSVGTIGNAYLIMNDKPFYFKDGNITWFRKYYSHLDQVFIFFWLKSSAGKKGIDNIKIGSTQEAITIEALQSLMLPMPPEEKYLEISWTLKNLIQKSRSNQLEIKLLSKLRDTLLPKLMSGEIRVKMD